MENIIISKDSYRVKDSSTSKGAAPKWNTEDNRWIKQSLLGYESLSEKVVSDLLRFSDLNNDSFVIYNMCNIVLKEEDNKVVEGCVSESFLRDGDSLYAFARILEYIGLDIDLWSKQHKSVKERFNSIVTIIKEQTGLDTTEYIKRCISLDYFILNEDRHLNNYAVILTKDNIFKECPLFDNGLPLLSDTTPNYYPIDHNPPSYYINKVKSSPVFSSNFKKQFDIICNGEPSFKFNKDKYIEYIESTKGNLGRITGILRNRLNTCPEFFILESHIRGF